MPKAATKPSIAVVGCGQWGANLVRNFAKLGVLSAVADVLPSRAEDAARSFGTVCASPILIPAWEEILQDPSITAVALATPAAQHTEMALAALRARKHVFIEKPLALTVEDGMRVVDAARNSGRTVMVGHSFRYHPAFQKLQDVVESGILGRIMHIHSRRLGFGRIRHDENVFWSLAPHDISMILALVGGGQPEVVRAQGKRLFRPNSSIPDVASADLLFPNGVHAHIHVSWFYPEKERKLIVVGERGTAVFDDTEQWREKLKVYHHEINWECSEPQAVRGRKETIALQDAESVANECRHFLECIDTGKDPLTDMTEGIAVIKALHLIDNAMDLDPSDLEESNASPGIAPLNAAVDMKHDPLHASAITMATSGFEKGFAKFNASSTCPPAEASQVTLIDLASQKCRIQQSLGLRLARVFDHMKFIMGPEVEELESRLSEFSGASHTVSCASGTDAITLALLALRIHKGDAVLVPALTFVASVEPIVLLGAVPIIVDVDPETLTIDPGHISAGVSAAHVAGLRPVGVIAVDLYGHPADYKGLRAALDALDEKKMWVIGDAAQSFGASLYGRRVGTLADITTTSFFPSKPLGCYGDGGAVMTDDAEIAETVRSLRLHGRNREEKFDNLLVGVNSRLDTIQAAVLLCKLEILSDEIALRQRVAAYYTQSLARNAATDNGGYALIVPATVSRNGAQSAWAAYTIRTTAADRPLVQEQLRASGIESIVYYPKPIHHQAAYVNFPVAVGSCPVAERACREVLSIPMHPYLQSSTQELVVEALRRNSS